MEPLDLSTPSYYEVKKTKIKFLNSSEKNRVFIFFYNFPKTLIFSENYFYINVYLFKKI